MNFPNEFPKTTDHTNRIFVQVTSQISLEVRGDDAFREIQKRILKWAFDPKRILRGIPDEAWEGKSFEIDAENSEQAAVIALEDPKYWAFRLKEGHKDGHRNWTTEVGLAEPEQGKIVFGCRVICSQRGNSEPYPRSIPRFVRGIAYKQDAWLDGRPTSPYPWFVDLEDDVNELVDFLSSPHRRHPVVAFAVPEDSDDLSQTAIQVDKFIRQTVGFVHSAVLSSNASYALTEKLGREFSVYRQAVRSYNPGFDPESDDLSDHPLATASTIREWESQTPNSFMDFLVQQTLRLTRPRDILEREHPPFQKVKRIVAERARSAAKAAGQSNTELLALADEEVRAAEEAAQENLALAVNADAEKEQALSELRQINARYMALQARVDTLQAQVAVVVKPTIDLPDSLEQIENWAKTHLAGAVELHNRALRGAKKAEYEDIKLIYNALLLLRDFYVPMRREGDAELRSAFKSRCQELGIEEQQTFSGNRAGEEGDSYYVRINQRPILLDRHLKKGTSRDPRYCFRLYFFWEKTTSQVVVGWLPSHLSTRAT